MVPWFVRYVLLTAGLGLALALAGCAQVDLESEFNSDGTAHHTIVKAVDPTMFEEFEEGLEDLAEEERADDEALQEVPDEEALEEEVEEGLDRDEIANSFDAVVVEAADAGLQSERIDEETQIGVRVSTEVADGDDLGEVLNLLYSVITEGEDDIDAFSGSFTTSEGEDGDEDGGSTSRFEVTADGDEILHPRALMSGTEDDDDETFQEAFLEAIQDSLEEDPEGEELREVFSLTYAVGMPGELVDHNGSELDDGRVLFNLPMQGTETFFVESEEVADVEESGFPLALTLGIGGGLLVVVLIIAGGIYLMGRREPAPEDPVDPETT